MDVRIGVTQSPKEIEVELSGDADAAKVKADIEKSMGQEDGVLWLTDKRGRQVGIPVGKVAYIEIGSPGEDRRIGFAGA